MAIEYFDGKSGELHTVRLEFDSHKKPSTLEIFVLPRGESLGSNSENWLISDLLLEDSHTGTDSRVHLRNRSIEGAMLTCSRSELPAGLEAELHRASPLLAFINSKRRLLFPLFGFALLSATAVYFGLPWISTRIAQRIPMSWEKALSDNLEGNLWKQNRAMNIAAAPALKALLARLSPALPEGGRNIAFGLLVVDDSTVNAFAAPGGLMLLNCGLIKQADSPDEVAGVLAHEMQHIISRHVTAGVVRMLTLSAIWKMTLGDFSSALEISPNTILGIASLKFSREDEAEADRGSLEILSRARISSAPMAHFFEKIGKEEKKGGKFMQGLSKLPSTHPATPDRMSLFSAGKNSPTVGEVLTPSEWKALRAACGANEKTGYPFDDE